jgi:hypothetical protein
LRDASGSVILADINVVAQAKALLSKPDSLPVVTIADADRVLQDRLYAEKVAVRALD